MAEDAKELGNDALKRKDYNKAVEHYTEAIRIDGQNHTYYSNRSAAYASMGKPVEALADAEKCIQMNPEFARGYGRKGLALYNLGRYSDAVVAYSAGLKKDTGNQSLTEGLAASSKAKELMERNLGSSGYSSSGSPGGGGHSQHTGNREWRYARPPPT
eukprot:COSAG01_NODE_178_length_22933_cov_18.398529_18_plen_158_part_00